METSPTGRWLSDEISSFYYDDADAHHAREFDNEYVQAFLAKCN